MTDFVPNIFSGSFTDDVSTLDENFAYVSKKRVSVKDFGAVGDGITNDYAAIVAALAYVIAIGGELYFPAGTYMVGAVIVVSGKCSIVGDGPGSIIEPLGAVSSLMSITSTQECEIRGLYFQNVSSRATSGLAFNSASDTAHRVHHCSFNGFSHGVENNSTDSWVVSDCYFIQNHTNVYSADKGTNSIVARCYMLGGNGCDFRRGAVRQPEGVRIAQNIILPAANALNATPSGIILRGTLAFEISGNMIDQFVANGVLIDLTTYSTSNLDIIGGWIGSNGTTTAVGVTTTGATGTATDVTITGGTISTCPTHGVSLDAQSSRWIFHGVKFQSNGTQANGTDIKLTSSLYIRVRNCNFESSGATFSLDETNNTTSSIVDGNHFNTVAVRKSTASFWGANFGPASVTNTWNTYTPTVAPTAGAFGSAATINNARYWQRDQVVNGMVEIANPDNGTGSGGLTIGLPVAAKTGKGYIGVGRNNSTGNMLQALISGSTMTVAKYENSYPWGTGETIFVSFSYEAN